MGEEWRVLVDRVLDVLPGHELASLEASRHPRAAFEEVVRPSRRGLRTVGE